MTVDSRAQEALDSAASRLAAVSRADPASAPPATRLSCLWATQLLGAAGARASMEPGGLVDSPSETIRAALSVLAALPAEVFAQHEIIEAAALAAAALASEG